MTLADDIRAVADRLARAEEERTAALLELRRLVTLNPVSWDPTEPNADDFANEQPGSSGPAGADAGEVEHAAAPSPAGAPIEQPGDDRAGVDEVAAGQVGISAAAPTEASIAQPDPEVMEAVTVVPPDQAARVDDALPPDPVPTPARQKGPSPGNVIDVTCHCGKHFAWKPGLVTHQRKCEAYLEAVTAPTNGASAEAAAPAPPHDTPIVRKGQEWWVCGRCPERFKTREKRDNHERLAHAPEERGRPVGTQRPMTHLGVPSVPGGGGMR